MTAETTYNYPAYSWDLEERELAHWLADGPWTDEFAPDFELTDLGCTLASISSGLPCCTRPRRVTSTAFGPRPGQANETQRSLALGFQAVVTREWLPIAAKPRTPVCIRFEVTCP